MKRIYLKDMYDWNHIQSLYDSGYSYNDIVRELKLGSQTPLFRGAKQGLLKSRDHSQATKMRVKLHGVPTVSQKTKDKLSEIIKEKVKNGSWHYSFSKTRTFSYTSKFAGEVKLQGSWEFKFAQYLDLHNIQWKRPTEKFYYEYHGLKRGSGYYTPDFYLVETDTWIEIKGYEHEKDRAKWKWFPHTLKILKGKQLTDDYKLDIQL